MRKITEKIILVKYATIPLEFIILFIYANINSDAMIFFISFFRNLATIVIPTCKVWSDWKKKQLWEIII